jgi:hypothetical protein
MKNILLLQIVIGAILLEFALSHFRGLYILEALTICLALFLPLGAIAALLGKRWGLWLSCVCQIPICLVAGYYFILAFKAEFSPGHSPNAMFFLLVSGPILLVALIGTSILFQGLFPRKPGAEGNIE